MRTEVSGKPHMKLARCVLASNLALVSKLSGLDCTAESAATVKHALPIKTLPESESWRVGLLDPSEIRV